MSKEGCRLLGVKAQRVMDPGTDYYEKGYRRYKKMKIQMKDEGFDYEGNKSMILNEMREGYTELRETSPEELEEKVLGDSRLKDIFLGKLFGRIVEYDPEACFI